MGKLGGSALETETSRCFIALLPPPEIQEYANTVIQELGDRYNTRVSKAPPHVTLQAPFRWPFNQIRQLEQVLQDFANAQVAVPITLSGFGGFRPRVLYIHVLKTPELLQLQAELMNTLEQTLQIVDPVAKQRAFSPHLTVASRNMNRHVFAELWSDLRTRPLEFHFTPPSLTLLIHDGQRWQIRSTFEFKSSGE